jgi:hypothetical protein
LDRVLLYLITFLGHENAIARVAALGAVAQLVRSLVRVDNSLRMLKLCLRLMHSSLRNMFFRN